MPHYPLRDIKALINNNRIEIRRNALQSAFSDFGWGPNDIKKCLLKLNDRPYGADRSKNHFHKTVTHQSIPKTEMDYYKAKNIMQGFSIYTHFYVHPQSGKLIISSFKQL